MVSWKPSSPPCTPGVIGVIDLPCYISFLSEPFNLLAAFFASTDLLTWRKRVFDGFFL